MNVREIAIQAIKDEAEAVLGLIPQLDESFDKAVDLILNCKGKVIVTGVGKSGHIGAKIAATLSSTGTPSFFTNPLDVFHGDLGVMTQDDVVLAISNSGQTDELLRFIPMVLHMQIPIIGMSGNPKSLLAKYSSCHLSIAVEKEACPLNLAPTSSTTATLVLGDALAIALMERRQKLPATRLCTVPPRWRAGKATADNGSGRDANRGYAYTATRDALRRGYHSGEQSQAGTWHRHGERRDSWTDYRWRHSSRHGEMAGRILRPHSERHHDTNTKDGET